MNPERLEHLARQLLAGRLDLPDFLHEAAQPATADLNEAQIDLDRRRRCGYPEVVYGEGKTVGTLERIFQALLATRRRRAGHARIGRTGRTFADAVSPGPLQLDGPYAAHRRGESRWQSRRQPATWLSSLPARAICRWPRKPVKRYSGWEPA